MCIIWVLGIIPKPLSQEVKKLLIIKPTRSGVVRPAERPSGVLCPSHPVGRHGRDEGERSNLGWVIDDILHGYAAAQRPLHEVDLLLVSSVSQGCYQGVQVIREIP